MTTPLLRPVRRRYGQRSCQVQETAGAMTVRPSMLTQAPLDGGRLLPNDSRHCTLRRIRRISTYTETHCRSLSRCEWFLIHTFNILGNHDRANLIETHWASKRAAAMLSGPASQNWPVGAVATSARGRQLPDVILQPPAAFDCTGDFQPHLAQNSSSSF